MAPPQRIAATMLALLSSLPISLAVYNSNEHLILTDCGIGSNPAHPEWADSFLAFYYPGDVNWDSSYPWRENSVTFTLTNGDVITTTIHPSVSDPGRAGSLTHTYDPGNSLTSISHGVHPANRDRIKIALSTTKDFAELSGNINPVDVFNQLSYGDNRKCDEWWKDIPGGQQIKFRCHGNKQVDWTWVPQTLSIDVSNADDADQGELSYGIDCSAAPQCDVRKKANFGAEVAVFVGGVFSPVAGIAAGLVAQGVTGACLAVGC
ncbi:hypothetical protein BU23DRAFT_571818 [Bimuria novae-zelandiae CBS 107.79]|uniref:Uncharacterized protein n=1 Tax=Bimuria novae-zelandiae CBS 107.79 TaxID=1447943 RepID=A0A6A5V6Y5_9PLEO|nr:hypothetical protein BU23DRAFT_571818 [Bimuria novae-zelandiae CBS 107.79]